MKKKILFFFIILISNNVKSQNFKGGLIGGVSTSQVSGDNLSGYNKWIILRCIYSTSCFFNFKHKAGNEFYSKIAETLK